MYVLRPATTTVGKILRAINSNCVHVQNAEGNVLLIEVAQLIDNENDWRLRER